MMRSIIAVFAFVLWLCAATQAVADECDNGESGSYSAMASCTSSRFDEAMADVVATYDQLLAELKSDKRRQAFVRESQNAWKDYLKSACVILFNAVAWIGPTCLNEIATNRSLELRRARFCIAKRGAPGCKNVAREVPLADIGAAYDALYESLDGDDELRASVVDSQRAWLRYREQSCAFWKSIQGPKAQWCVEYIPKERLNLLHHMRSCYLEGGNEC